MGLLLIGEKITVASKSISHAIKEREKRVIQDLAASQVEAGANMVDLSIGPATKDGPATMEWLVKAVQEVVDVPLSLDTTNPQAMEAGLKVHKGQALINSTTAEKDRLEGMVPLAKKYDANIIGLTMTEAGIPRDANERAAIAVDILAALAEHDVPFERLYLDPLILSIGVMQNQACEVMTALALFKQLNDPPIKTLAALSNVFNGCPNHVKGVLGRTYLAMLMTIGVDAIIMNPLEKEIMDTIKTVQVYKNEVLYAHSYLD